MHERRLLVIPGAQKAGTTSLYGLLLQHECIHSLTPPPGARWEDNWKEPHFFAFQEAVVEQHLDWYLSLLDEDDGWYVDASTSYLTAPRTPELLRRLPLPVRYLAILRDPVERAFSAYRHMRREDPPADRRSFDEIIDYVWARRGEDLAAAENDGIRSALSDGRVDLNVVHRTYLQDQPASSTSDLQDGLHLFKYLQQGMYSQRLQPYWSSSSEVLTVGLEALSSAPSRIGRSIFDHLDLDHRDGSLPHLNRGRSGRSWWTKLLDRIENRAPGLEPVVGLVRSFASSSAGAHLCATTLQRTRQLLADEYQYWTEHRPTLTEHWRHGP